MDLLAAELGADMAKEELGAEGKAGGGTIKKYTYDGNTEGKIVVPFSEQISFVKVSDDTPDLNELLSFIGEGETAGQSSTSTTYPDDVLISVVGEGSSDLFGAKGSVVMDGPLPRVVVVTDISGSPIPSTGLYLSHVADNSVPMKAWISEIEFGKVYPIAQKFIPDLDFIVLKDQEGKRYKVTVKHGALQATAI